MFLLGPPRNHTVKTRIKSATLWVDCELWNDAAGRLIKCGEKGDLKGRKIQVTGALANSHWKKKILGNVEVSMNTKYCKVRSFELLGAIRNDDSLIDDSTELDDILEAEDSELGLFIRQRICGGGAETCD